jgi:2-hydroxymethylglutarate dehydrogenase
LEIIGFIGLGVMGLPMTKRLIQAGHELFIYDLDAKPISILEGLGAKRCESPKDLASRADIVISMLPNPAITRQVILGDNGVVHGFKSGMIYIDMSTSNPLLTKEIHEILKSKNVDMLDAPVSGGIKGATEGTLTIMVGGNHTTLDNVRGILSLMGGKVIHVGEIGSGHTIKIINNMLFAVIMAATSEALALGKKAGIELQTMRNVLNSSSGHSYALDVKVRDFIFPREFDQGFAVELQNKDTDLALELAKNVGAPVILGNLVRQMYQTLIIKGYGKKDTSSIVTLFEELMGTGEGLFTGVFQMLESKYSVFFSVDDRPLILSMDVLMVMIK